MESPLVVRRKWATGSASCGMTPLLMRCVTPAWVRVKVRGEG